MQKLIVALIFCLCGSLAFGAQKVQQPQSPQNPFAPQGADLPDVTLTAASVQQLISSFGALRAQFKDFKPSGDAQDMPDYLRANDAAFKKAESIVREAGFKDFADWSAHFSRTMQAYMAYKMQGAGKLSHAQQAHMEQQIKAMQNDPNLTAEQKQMALNMMGMADMYNQMASNVPEQDLKTIEPFIGQLEQVMQENK
ncbi:MAG TPA: hypothetical protein VFX02_04465 [Gammaproteobacteria bacterium]|nr:hypothetical protein [Gammaproteobacteria bacterium]